MATAETVLDLHTVATSAPAPHITVPRNPNTGNGLRTSTHIPAPLRTASDHSPAYDWIATSGYAAEFPSSSGSGHPFSVLSKKAAMYARVICAPRNASSG